MSFIRVLSDVKFLYYCSVIVLYSICMLLGLKVKSETLVLCEGPLNKLFIALP